MQNLSYGHIADHFSPHRWPLTPLGCHQKQPSQWYSANLPCLPALHRRRSPNQRKIPIQAHCLQMTDVLLWPFVLPCLFSKCAAVPSRRKWFPQAMMQWTIQLSTREPRLPTRTAGRACYTIPRLSLLLSSPRKMDFLVTEDRHKLIWTQVWRIRIWLSTRGPWPVLGHDTLY